MRPQDPTIDEGLAIGSHRQDERAGVVGKPSVVDTHHRPLWARGEGFDQRVLVALWELWLAGR